MWCVRVGVKVCCVDIHWECCVLWKLLGWFMLVSGIYGAEWVLMGVVLLWRFGLAVAWGVVFCEVCNRCGCGCEGGCCGITVEDGDDCGWWCVLKGVVYGCVVWFVMGVVGKM